MSIAWEEEIQKNVTTRLRGIAAQNVWDAYGTVVDMLWCSHGAAEKLQTFKAVMEILPAVAAQDRDVAERLFKRICKATGLGIESFVDKPMRLDDGTVIVVERGSSNVQDVKFAFIKPKQRTLNLYRWLSQRLCSQKSPDENRMTFITSDFKGSAKRFLAIPRPTYSVRRDDMYFVAVVRKALRHPETVPSLPEFLRACGAIPQQQLAA